MLRRAILLWTGTQTGKPLEGFLEEPSCTAISSRAGPQKLFIGSVLRAVAGRSNVSFLTLFPFSLSYRIANAAYNI